MESKKKSKPFSIFDYPVLPQHFLVAREITSCRHKNLCHRLLFMGTYLSLCGESAVSVTE